MVFDLSSIDNRQNLLEKYVFFSFFQYFGMISNKNVQFTFFVDHTHHIQFFTTMT